jgi:hypothetical protein
MNELIGLTVTEFRPMTSEEMEEEGWDSSPPPVLVFSDGNKLYPSRDEEGNGPGAFFGVDPSGTTIIHL